VEQPVPEVPEAPGEERDTTPGERIWLAGHDVRHAQYGPGWVQGSGLGRVTVRFETPGSEPGRVRTFRTDDPLLEPAEPLPLVPEAPEATEPRPTPTGTGA
jgi:DNA polymerase-4